MINNLMSLTKSQLAQLGPVRPVPPAPNPGLERAEREKRLAEFRDLAAFADMPGFIDYCQRKHTTALAALLAAPDDDQRRQSQATARAWAAIYKDVVTAKEQVAKLTEELSQST